MKYIIMKESIAIEKGVIPEDHYFPTQDNQVIFKKDMLTIFGQQGYHLDFEYKELETPEALKMIETWN